MPGNCTRPGTVCTFWFFFTIHMVNKPLANHIQRPFKALFSACINPGQQHGTKMHGELRSEHFQRLKCSTKHSSKEMPAESTRECENLAAQKDTAPGPWLFSNASAIKGSGEGPGGSTRHAEACILLIQWEANNPITAFSLFRSQSLMNVLRKMLRC